MRLPDKITPQKFTGGCHYIFVLAILLNKMTTENGTTILFSTGNQIAKDCLSKMVFGCLENWSGSPDMSQNPTIQL
jgi:hypothetical protein